MNTVNKTKCAGILVTILFVALLTSGCDSVKNLVKDCPIRFTGDSSDVDEQGKITVRFTLSTCNNEPIPNLDNANYGEHITLFEDGSEISILESSYRIMGIPQAYEFDTILLLDMSGSVVSSEDFPILISSAQNFVKEIAPGKNIAVYTFDGRPGYEIEQVVDFTADVADLNEGIQKLESYTPVDPSTNLYGAIEEALNILENRQDLRSSDSLLRSASLVVFTDGTHRAGSGRRGYPAFVDIMTQISDSYYSVYTIGLGGEVNEQELKTIGKTGSAFAKNAEDLPDAFDLLVDYSNSSYVVTYCSPARAGLHTLQIRVNWKRMEGIYLYDFDANNFTGNCTP